MLSRSAVIALGLSIVFGAFGYFAGYSLTVSQAPRTVMASIEDKVVAGAGGWNRCMHNRQFGPVHGGAKRANPDSMISIMAYDVSQEPVRISGEVWPDYWSMSLYEQNSDNFFVVNDRQLKGGDFDYVIAKAGSEVAVSNAVVIETPSDKGIMLIRRFISDESDLEQLLANQDKLRCGSIG